MTRATRADWTVRRIKTLATKIGSGKTPLGGAESYLNSGIPFLRSQNVHFGGIRLDDVAYIDESTHRSMGISRIFDGDVLLNITGASLGRVASVPPGFGEANVNQHVCIIRPNGDADARFLASSLSASGVQGQILSLQVGGNRDGLNFEQVGNLEVLIPGLGEQCRIADFLDAEIARMASLFSRRQRMRELLTLRRERVIEEVLKIDQSGSGREFVPLRHLVQEVTVGIVVTPAKWYVDDGGIPSLRGLNVQSGRIVSDDIVRISVEGDAVNRKSRLKAGDVVVVRTGQAGAAAVVPQELDGANCIDLIIVRPGAALNSRYLEYILNSDYARRQVEENSVGSIQAHFNVGAMKQMPIPSTPVEEQERMVAMLDEQVGAMDLLAARLMQQDDLLAERRQALITAAVTGQFDVSTASGRGVE